MAEDHSKSTPAGTGILDGAVGKPKYYIRKHPLQYGTAGDAPAIPDGYFAKLWNAQGQQVNAVTTNYIPTGSSWTATPDDYAFEILFAFTVRELDTILVNNNSTVVYVYETGKMYRVVDTAADTLHTFLTSGYAQPGVKIKTERTWEEVTVDPVTKHIYKFQEILNPSTPPLEIKLDHEQEQKYLEFEKGLILSNTPGRLDKPYPNREKQLEQKENDIVKYKDSGQQDPLGSCISPITGYIN